jgi:hypothetical protein
VWYVVAANAQNVTTFGALPYKALGEASGKAALRMPTPHIQSGKSNKKDGLPHWMSNSPSTHTSISNNDLATPHLVGAFSS